MGVLASTRVGLGVDEFSLETNFGSSLVAHPHPDDAEPAASLKPEFGAKNSWRWMVQLGAGFDPRQSDNQFGLAGGGVNFFIAENLSLNLELNGMYFAQLGSDQGGINFALLFRWHFFAQEKWSVYFDAGAGLLAATGKVPAPSVDHPDGGSSFNFTPQGGFGVTVEIAENVRAFAGARIYHISNAQVFENNPGRDSIYIYGGVSFPF